MLETSTRLLRLLALLQARRFWPGADLAERLEVTRRTLRRDVDRLRRLGYPVDSSAGVAGGYQLAAGAVLPPLSLDDEEATAVSLALRTVAAGSIAGLEEAALRALGKLERVLPSRLRRRVRAMQSSIVPLHFGGERASAETLTALAAASQDNRSVSFPYAGPVGPGTHRRVQPHGLVHAGRRWYLVAWDLDRDDWRTFRVDRIGAEPAVGESFLARAIPGGGLAEFVSRSVASAPYPVQARFLLHAPISRVAAKVAPLAAHVRADGPERCILEAGASSAAGLAAHIAALGEEFEVLDPPEVVAELEQLIERLARAVELSRGK